MDDLRDVILVNVCFFGGNKTASPVGRLFSPPFPSQQLIRGGLQSS